MTIHPTNQEERQDLSWKCRKEAMTILVHLLNIYGGPENVSRHFKVFAKWFLENYFDEIIKVILKDFVTW